MDLNNVYSALWNLGWPDYVLPLIAVCFLVSLLCWRLSGDVVSAYSLGFSLPFAITWLQFLVPGVLGLAADGVAPALVQWIFLAESTIAVLLFLRCSFASWDAMMSRKPLPSPVRTAGVLIAAIALHFHIRLSMLFYALQQPPLEYRLIHEFF